MQKINISSSNMAISLFRSFYFGRKVKTLLSVSSSNFRINNSSTQRKNNSLAQANTLLRSPNRDEVSFGCSAVQDFLPILNKTGLYRSVLPKEIRSTFIFERDPFGAEHERVPAFLIKEGGQKGIELVCSRGGFLGQIQTLDETDWKDSRYPVGKYLRLRNLNASFYNDYYKGIGTALVKGAQVESRRLGMGGQLKVLASNVFAPSQGSPVPFYAKLGFVATDFPHMTKEELIENYSKPEALESTLSMMLLTSENLQRLKDFHNKK